MARQKIVRRVEEISNAVNDMHKAMEHTPEQEIEKKSEITNFKKKFPDAIYLEPVQRIPTSGVRHPKIDKDLEYLKEYVVGIFESQMITGFIEFDLGVIPGEDYCRWKIPVNKTVGIPRFVAQHLRKGLSWKEMIPIGQTSDPETCRDEEIMKPFSKFITKRRGTFNPIEAY